MLCNNTFFLIAVSRHSLALQQYMHSLECEMIIFHHEQVMERLQGRAWKCEDKPRREIEL